MFPSLTKMGKGRFFNVIIILQFTMCISAYAEDCRWKEVIGEALAENITVEEAWKLALKRARITAIEEISGTTVYGSAMVKNSHLVEDFVMTLTEGYILKEDILRWEAEFKNISDDKPPLPLYKVYARCCISTDKIKRDHFFTISAETNKRSFVSGDEATIKIRTSRGSYITVFHLGTDEKLRILLPNQFQRRGYIEEGREFVFPPRGLGLKVKTSNRKKEVEYFIVVGTKEWFDFEGQLSSNKDISLSSFYSALLSIPADMRAIAIAAYEVVEK